MASGFPKLPGYVPTQDLEVHLFLISFSFISFSYQTTNWKRVSAQKQDQNRDSVLYQPCILNPKLFTLEK